MSRALSPCQRTANIKLMCKLGKSAVETLLVWQTDYGDNVLKRQLCVIGVNSETVSSMKEIVSADW